MRGFENILKYSPSANLFNIVYLSLVFLVSGALYEASYETSFAIVLYDSPLSESKVKQNW